MNRRFAHGGTSRPSLSRPGNGYGRPTRPGPAMPVEAAQTLEPAMFVAPVPVASFKWDLSKNLAPSMVWDTEAQATPPEPMVIERPSVAELFEEETA